MSLIYDCEDLKFEYQLGKQKVQALRGANFKVHEGDVHLLLGPSGSGKSTLLNLLGLIEPVQAGTLAFQGKDIRGLSEAEKNHLRRFKIGFIFQSFLLFEVLTAAENVEYFLGQQGIEAKERKERVKHALKVVGLEDQMHKRPPEMSGGQRQRVAIARALAKRPSVIIADEPTASLDQKTSRDVLSVLKSLSHEGVTILMSSHDPLAEEYCTVETRIMDGLVRSEAKL